MQPLSYSRHGQMFRTEQQRTYPEEGWTTSPMHIKIHGVTYHRPLTLHQLTWKIWRAPNNASRWQLGFNSAFKGLIITFTCRRIWSFTHWEILQKASYTVHSVVCSSIHISFCVLHGIGNEYFDVSVSWPMQKFNKAKQLLTFKSSYSSSSSSSSVSLFSLSSCRAVP